MDCKLNILLLNTSHSSNMFFSCKVDKIIVFNITTSLNFFNLVWKIFYCTTKPLSKCFACGWVSYCTIAAQIKCNLLITLATSFKEDLFKTNLFMWASTFVCRKCNLVVRFFYMQRTAAAIFEWLVTLYTNKIVFNNRLAIVFKVNSSKSCCPSSFCCCNYVSFCCNYTNLSFFTHLICYFCTNLCGFYRAKLAQLWI